MSKDAQDPSVMLSLAADELGCVPVRMLSGEFVGLSHPRRKALQPLPIARVEGRYHRKGAPPPLYASSTEAASLYELLRQLSDIDGCLQIRLSEIKHPVHALHVCNLPVYDLTDELVREQFGVVEGDLVGDDYGVCHAITDLLTSRPDLVGGLLAPSAAVRGEQTLVVFQERIRIHVSVTKALQANSSRLERLTASITIANAISALPGAVFTIAALVRYVL